MWTLLWIFLWIMWVFLLVRTINDVFRSHDLSGAAKAAWIVALILFPLISVVVYLIVRGARMQEHEQTRAVAADNALRSYIQSAAGTSSSTAEELSKLAHLRDLGELTPEEFVMLKTRLLSTV